jgi:hypothetical protein
MRLITLLVLFVCGGHAEPARGLSVSPKGILLKDGAPYRGVGVNYFDVFLQLLKEPADRTLEYDFEQLANAGIPFIRFAASGFWPKDNDLYRKDKASYFERLDRVVRAAEAAGIGLIPTLFWHFATVPDMSGEPVSAWGDPKSRTHRFMRRYTREVVRRYRGSSAIWAWEFGNEWNDHIDLPPRARYRASVVPELGTPAARTEADDLKLEMLVTDYAEFAKEVRRHDPYRAISAGSNLTRASAARRNSMGDGPDPLNDWTWMLLRQNAPFPLISVHVYLNRHDYFPEPPAALPELLEFLVRIGYASRKPVFLGEFGTVAGNRTDGVDEFRTLLDAIEKARVPLSAIWNFGPRRLGDGINWNIYFGNPNEWMLGEIAKANARMHRYVQAWR